MRIIALALLLSGCAALDQPMMFGQPLESRSNPPPGNSLLLVIDDEPAGTLTAPGLIYETGAGVIYLHTAEGLYCQPQTVWHDRFEDAP